MCCPNNPEFHLLEDAPVAVAMCDRHMPDKLTYADTTTALQKLQIEMTERKLAEEALRQSEARFRELLAREELLNQLANQIRNTLDLNTILETAVQQIGSLLQVDRCQFAWYFPQADEPYWEVVKEVCSPSLPNLIGRYLTVVGPLAQILNMQILRVDDVEAAEKSMWQEFVSLGMLSVLILPIQTHSGAIGAIGCSHGSIRPWSDSEVELLQAVTDQLAIAINQAELYAQTREAAQIAQAQKLELEQALQELQKAQVQLVQTEKMSSLGQLVTGVAHEINNPINFIYGNLAHAGDYTQDVLGLVQMYRQQYPNPTPEIQEEIETIDLDFIFEDLPKLLSSMKMGTERICEIVLSLRRFSHLDAAQMKPADIHEGIESTLLILQNRLKAKPEHPDIQVIKEYGELPLIECYAGQMNQVFMNLLANAIDALEEGRERTGQKNFDTFLGPQRQLSGRSNLHRTGKESISPRLLPEPRFPSPFIRIRTRMLDNQQVAIHIADNGPGMTEEVRQRLFDPFFTTKPIGVGTGLGLSISHQIVVEKHGGQLHCFSQVGQGTEFVIQLPLQQDVSAEGWEEPESSASYRRELLFGV